MSFNQKYCMAAVSTRYDWTYPSDYYLSSTTSLSLPPPLGCWPATCGKAGLLFIKLSYPMTKLPIYMLVKNAGVVAHKPRDHYRFTLKEERNETNSGNSDWKFDTLFLFLFIFPTFLSVLSQTGREVAIRERPLKRIPWERNAYDVGSYARSCVPG